MNHRRRQKSPPQRRALGVTLIEMLVALAIVALLATAAAPALGRAIDRARFNGGTREIVSALKSARHEARSAGHEASFTLDVQTHAYSVAGRERRLEVPSTTTLVLLTGDSERLGATRGAIRFFPDGSATGGSVILVFRDRQQSVSVDWITGAIRTDTQ